MPERRVKILPDGPDWEWYQELADGSLPPTKAELWRPYVPRPAAVDTLVNPV